MPSARHSLTRDEARALDRRALDDFGIASLQLMENAGRGAADLLMALGIHGPVLIVAGKGNNAGDAFVLARRLTLFGIVPQVVLVPAADQLSRDASANFRCLEKLGVPVMGFEPARLAQDLCRSEWVVDGLFGTGLRGPAGPPYEEVITSINASSARAFALDVPSGMDADTGEPHGPTVRAKHTATFAAAKIGFANPRATTWLGRVHIVDIGGNW